VQDGSPTTIALLGGNSLVGQALSLLLRGAGYDTRVLEAPPTGRIEYLLGGVDLLLICPGLGAARREESLALLREPGERMPIPVLELSTAIEEELLSEEVGIVPWPSDIDGLAREIEAPLKAAAQDLQAGIETPEEPPLEGEPAL
jgi:hypothetical protein